MKIVALFAVLLIVPVVVAFVYLPWYYALVVVAGVVFIGPRLVRAVFVRGARRIVRAVGSEMMLDDIGHGDIESWIAKWEDRMATEAADVMTAAPHAGARSVSLPPPCFHF